MNVIQRRYLIPGGCCAVRMRNKTKSYINIVRGESAVKNGIRLHKILPDPRGKGINNNTRRPTNTFCCAQQHFIIKIEVTYPSLASDRLRAFDFTMVVEPS